MSEKQKNKNRDEKTIYYYIDVASWNLLESFITESISPYSFYAKRDFGNNLSRYIDPHNERKNVLILSKENLGGDYTIRIDEDLVDKKSLEKKKSKLYTYSQTLYYKKGMVKFGFSSEELRDSLIAESQILSDVKCIEKYRSGFYIRKAKNKKQNRELSFDFDESLNPVEFDNRYNRYKGAAIGFLRGLLTSIDGNEITLRKKINDLKNAFAGLNTRIKVDDVPVENAQFYFGLIDESKELYNLHRNEKTNLFDILKQRFEEVVRISGDRVGKTEIDNLQNRRADIEHKIKDCENKIREASDRCKEVEKSLDEIRQKEKNKGEEKGKKRKFFKEGSPEYEEKIKLNESVKALKKEISEKREERNKLNNDLEEIKKKLKNSDGSLKKYDGYLSALFDRISDICNELIKKITSTYAEISIKNTELLQVDSNGKLMLNTQKDEKDAEIVYFEIVLNYVLGKPINSSISDELIKNIIIESANLFEKEDKILEMERGKKIIECLRDFCKYKEGKKPSFSIPEEYPILQSIMAFFIKPNGFDQIERFMLNKEYQYKSYAFAIWGACLGFYAIPKTFTDILFKNDDTIKLIDDYLDSIMNAIKNK